jgi:hypothetical protein
MSIDDSIDRYTWSQSFNPFIAPAVAQPPFLHPQLPAYAVAMDPPPGAIAFARIRPEDLRFDPEITVGGIFKAMLPAASVKPALVSRNSTPLSEHKSPGVTCALKAATLSRQMACVAKLTRVVG